MNLTIPLICLTALFCDGVIKSSSGKPPLVQAIITFFDPIEKSFVQIKEENSDDSQKLLFDEIPSFDEVNKKYKKIDKQILYPIEKSELEKRSEEKNTDSAYFITITLGSLRIDKADKIFYPFASIKLIHVTKVDDGDITSTNILDPFYLIQRHNAIGLMNKDRLFSLGIDSNEIKYEDKQIQPKELNTILEQIQKSYELLEKNKFYTNAIDTCIALLLTSFADSVKMNNHRAFTQLTGYIREKYGGSNNESEILDKESGSINIPNEWFGSVNIKPFVKAREQISAHLRPSFFARHKLFTIGTVSFITLLLWLKYRQLITPSFPSFLKITKPFPHLFFKAKN